MPAMMVCPVSLSVYALNVGSSSASLDRAIPIFSCPALVLGSIATRITGSGNSMDSKNTGCLRSQRVSPVLVFRKPTAAAISPA